MRTYPVMPCETICRPIPDYENYTIDIYGNIRNIVSGRYLSHSDRGYGYMRVSLSKNNKAKTMQLHRILAIVFLKNDDNKPMIDHINGIRSDNRLENLRWVTSSENNTNLKIRSTNKSGVSGISIHRYSYNIRVEVDGIRYNKYIAVKSENSLQRAIFQKCLFEIQYQTHSRRIKS